MTHTEAEINGTRRDTEDMAQDRPRVVVIEDDRAIRSALEVALRDEGYSVNAQPNGSAIEGTMERYRPDLAILDVRLGPGRDGYALAAAVRATSDIPILFLTAADSISDRHGHTGPYGRQPFARSPSRRLR